MSALAEAVKLLEDALFLRMNGERPPGAPRDNLKAETWPDWDTRCETFLRKVSAGSHLLRGSDGKPKGG